LDPILAIQLVTLNPAEYFGLNHLGAVAPGRQADLVVFSDLNSPVIEQVYHHGVLVAENGTILPAIKQPPSITVAPCMNVNLEGIDFTLPAEGDRIRVMEIIPDQVITRHSVAQATLSGKQVVSDPARDLLKIVVVERHTGSGNMGRAFVRGMGLTHGALASSVAHDSHNIIIVGTNDRDMRKALETVVQMGGGLAAVSDAKTLASLPLPVAGLMSLDPVEKVKNQIDHLIAVSHEMGSELKDPFMTLSFLALPVIPELKITDKGLVDVNEFKIVPLFV
jgi:adenine deaminase